MAVWQKLLSTTGAPNCSTCVLFFSSLTLSGHFTKDWFFQSARSGTDCPQWICFYRPVFRPESPPIVPFFDRVVLLKKNSRSKPVGPWSLGRQMVPWRSSCLDRPLELSFILYRSLPMVVRSVDGHPALTRSSDDQDFSFSTCLTTVADHFFGTRPSEDWGNRARSSSRRYRVVLDSVRRFPTIFAKMCPIEQK